MTTDPSERRAPVDPGPAVDALPDASGPGSPFKAAGPPPVPPQPPVALPIPPLAPDTAMQKVVLPGLVDLYLGNVVVPARFEPHRTAGFVTRLQDVPTAPAEELGNRYGLDQVPGWPRASELYMLRFYAHSPAPFIAPFERNVYQMDLMELAAGTELWRIGADGSERRMAAYLHRQIGWVPTGEVWLGPARWFPAPVPLRPTVRRGLVARYRGEDFDADFGPRPGQVTLHPLPGRPAPAGFADQAGARTATVERAELETLQLVRWRTTWRGLPVALVDSGPTHAVVHYLGEAGERAAEQGMAEVDYRVWRGSAPHAELDDAEPSAQPVSA